MGRGPCKAAPPMIVFLFPNSQTCARFETKQFFPSANANRSIYAGEAPKTQKATQKERDAPAQGHTSAQGDLENNSLEQTRRLLITPTPLTWKSFISCSEALESKQTHLAVSDLHRPLRGLLAAGRTADGTHKHRSTKPETTTSETFSLCEIRTAIRARMVGYRPVH